MAHCASITAIDGVVIGAATAIVDASVDSHIGEVFVAVGGEGTAFATADVEEAPSLARAAIVGQRELLAATDCSCPG